MSGSDASSSGVLTDASIIDQTNSIQLLSRNELDPLRWDACVAGSTERIVYGYSWYLDAVLPKPDWQWVGLVIADEAGEYQAVMPIPLRRKSVSGLTYSWVVHQPFFCQFLTVFRRDTSINLAWFLEVMYQTYRYASILNCRAEAETWQNSMRKRTVSTHVLDLSVGYTSIYSNYSSDRRRNLRLAQATDWIVIQLNDPQPLITLFRNNHASDISGGVSGQAYDMLEKLVQELIRRGLASLQYTTYEGKIEAGALFVQEGNRLIYLFNAASEVGRRGNARTLLIDQQIQKHAGRSIILDFESPEKPSIRLFYESFGATEEGFCSLHWNRLTKLEQVAIALKNKIARH
jgi:hypothetical protein